MFEIKVDNQPIEKMLHRIQAGTRNMQPLMLGIAAELRSETENNFQTQGRPEWNGLSDTTKALRTQAGQWPGKILVVTSGGLAASIVTSADAAHAMVGSNKVYAAMQQFGGTTAANSMIPGKEIAARPFLPLAQDKKLQPETEAAILELALDYLQKLASP